MKFSADTLGIHTVKCLNALRSSHKEFSALAIGLEKLGEVALVGGAVRDWALHKKPRDLDLVVDTCPQLLEEFIGKQYLRRTRYGGFHLIIDGIYVDVWALSTTWAFSHLAVEPADMTFEKLPQTAFFNADAIAVRWSDAKVFQCGFFDAFVKRELGSILEENPYPHLCAARGLVLARKYNLFISKSLLNYFQSQIENGLSWADIVNAQICHYGHQPLSKTEVEYILPENLSLRLLGKEIPSQQRWLNLRSCDGTSANFSKSASHQGPVSHRR